MSAGVGGPWPGANGVGLIGTSLGQHDGVLPILGTPYGRLLWPGLGLGTAKPLLPTLADAVMGLGLPGTLLGQHGHIFPPRLGLPQWPGGKRTWGMDSPGQQGCDPLEAGGGGWGLRGDRDLLSARGGI